MNSLFSMIPLSIRRFRKTEKRAVTALELVMILAIIAMVLIVVIAVGQEIVTWAKDWIYKIIKGNGIN